MLYNWCAEMVGNFKDSNDYLELEMEVIRTLAQDLPFDAEQFQKSKEEELTEQLFLHLSERYSSKQESIRQQAYPVFQHIRQEQGERIENVIVPFTDGIHQYQFTVSMQKALDSHCKSMVQELEKSTTLEVIDDEWKEHLRELDDLKQSTSNAQYEQKDPLLIYKIESFELYGKMLQRINQKVLGHLFRLNIHQDSNVQEAKPQLKRNNPKIQTSREELAAGNSEAQSDSAAAAAPRPTQNPIINDLKIGRNDPCPCGSGKKFKACHGRD